MSQESPKTENNGFDPSLIFPISLAIPPALIVAGIFHIPFFSAFSGWGWLLTFLYSIPAFVISMVIAKKRGNPKSKKAGHGVAYGKSRVNKDWATIAQNIGLTHTVMLNHSTGAKFRAGLSNRELATSQIQFPGVVVPPQDTPLGFMFQIALPEGMTRSQVENVMPALAGALGAPDNSIFVRSTTTAANLWIEVAYRNAWDGQEILPQPGTDLSNVYLGIEDNGQPLYGNFTEHLLVSGSTRKGKTNFVKGVISPLLAHPGYLIYFLDGKGGMEANEYNDESGWSPFAGTTRDVATTADLLRQVDEFMVKRQGTLNVAKIQDDPRYLTKELPAVVLFIDEAASLFGKSAATGDDKKHVEDCVRHLKRITEQGLSCGVSVILGIQNATSDNLPTQIRGLFGNRISFKVNGTGEVTAVFPELTGAEATDNPLSPYRLANPGEAVWVSEEGFGSAKRFKAPLWTKDDTRLSVAAAAQIKKPNPS